MPRYEETLLARSQCLPTRRLLHFSSYTGRWNCYRQRNLDYKDPLKIDWRLYLSNVDMALFMPNRTLRCSRSTTSFLYAKLKRLPILFVVLPIFFLNRQRTGSSKYLRDYKSPFELSVFFELRFEYLVYYFFSFFASSFLLLRQRIQWNYFHFSFCGNNSFYLREYWSRMLQFPRWKRNIPIFFFHHIVLISWNRKVSIIFIFFSLYFSGSTTLYTTVFLNVHYPIAAFDSYTLFFSFSLDFDDKKSWQNLSLSLSLSNISPSFSSSNNDRISSSKPRMFARSRSFSTFLHSLSLSSSLQHISPTSKDLFTFIYLLFFLSTQLECWVFFTMSLSLSLSIKPHTSVSIISTLIVKTDLSRRARTMFLISSLYKLICWQNVFFHPITPLLF